MAFSARTVRSLTAVAALSVLAVVTAGAEQPGRMAQEAACTAQADWGVAPSRLTLLARGFNLTGWFDRVPAQPPSMPVLASLHARGFTHVRLPITAERLADAFAGRPGAARLLSELDRAIDGLIALGFAVTIDMHPGDRIANLEIGAPERAFELLDTLWQMLARRYADRPAERLFFEVLNEPTADPAVWAAYGPRLAATIRRQAPNHTIIYPPASYQRIDALADLAPLADLNVVYAVHFYDPLVFTHQGLDWAGDDPLRHLDGVPFPAKITDPAVARMIKRLQTEGHAESAIRLKAALELPWTEPRIDQEFAGAAAWASRHRRPVILNEFGVLQGKAGGMDRLRWLGAVRAAAERHCVGWAHWEYADGFGFVQRVDGREVPDPAVVDALLGGR